MAAAPLVFDLKPLVTLATTREHQSYSLNKKSQESRCERVEDSRW